MKAVVIVVDMLKDNVGSGNSPVSQEIRRIIPSIQTLLSSARKLEVPIVYANDSFLPGDFIFQGRQPHAVRGTEGNKVIPELEPKEGDIIVEKRRFSAFFKTDLDMTLRNLGIDTVAVAGIAIEACTLMTAMDAISNDFYAIILEDCCTSPQRENYETIVNVYRNLKMFSPIMRILSAEEFLSAVGNS